MLFAHCVSWGIQVGKRLLRDPCTEMEDRVWGNFIQLLPGSASLVLEQPCVTLPPYPHIFSSLLSRQGFLPDDLSSYSTAGNMAPCNYCAIENNPVRQKGPTKVQDPLLSLQNEQQPTSVLHRVQAKRLLIDSTVEQDWETKF